MLENHCFIYILSTPWQVYTGNRTTQKKTEASMFLYKDRHNGMAKKINDTNDNK